MKLAESQRKVEFEQLPNKTYDINPLRNKRAVENGTQT